MSVFMIFSFFVFIISVIYVELSIFTSDETVFVVVAMVMIICCYWLSWLQSELTMSRPVVSASNLT